MLLTVLTKPKPVIQTSATLTLPTPPPGNHSSSSAAERSQQAAGTQFTRFASTKVQILTRKALLAARAAGEPLQAPAGAQKKKSSLE